jgi:uncharacterized protein
MTKGRKTDDEALRKLDSIKRKEEDLLRREKALAEMDRRGKDLHYLHCPRCGHALTTVLAENLEVEACEPCKGVWLGKTELEVLVKLPVEKRKGFLNHLFGIA